MALKFLYVGDLVLKKSSFLEWEGGFLDARGSDAQFCEIEAEW